MSKIRFYKYFFRGVDKPVIMEATDRTSADQMMQQLKQNTTANLSAKDLIDIRVETPIIGISKRKRHNQDYVWVGTEFTSDGWLLQTEYNEIEKLKQQQK
jgi:putative N-acetylmannosamine-6-phosphate epimerase